MIEENECEYCAKKWKVIEVSRQTESNEEIMIAKRIILILISLFVRCSFDKYAYRNNNCVIQDKRNNVREKEKEQMWKWKKKRNKCIDSRVIRLQTRHSLFFFSPFPHLTLVHHLAWSQLSILLWIKLSFTNLFASFRKISFYRIYIYRSSNEFLFFSFAPSPLPPLLNYPFIFHAYTIRRTIFLEAWEKERKGLCFGNKRKNDLVSQKLGCLDDSRIGWDAVLALLTLTSTYTPDT